MPPTSSDETVLKNKVEKAVEALRELKESPDGAALAEFSKRLRELGLPGVDVTPGPYNPWTDPRLGSTANLDAIEVGVAALKLSDVRELERSIKSTASAAERWAGTIGALAAIAVRIGAAFVGVPATPGLPAALTRGSGAGRF